MSSSPFPDLPAIGFLTDVSEEDRSFLTGFGKFIRPSVGDQIITEGSPQESLFLILSGILHVTTQVEGRDVLTIGLLGKDGGTCAARCDTSFIVPADDSAHIQEAHQVIMHIICEMLEYDA